MQSYIHIIYVVASDDVASVKSVRGEGGLRGVVGVFPPQQEEAKKGEGCSLLVHYSAAVTLQEGKTQQQQHAHKLQTRRALERVRHAAAEEGTMQENNVGVFGGAHVVQELRVPGYCVRPSLRRGPGPAGTLLGRGRPGPPLVPALESDAARPGSGVPELVGERVS